MATTKTKPPVIYGDDLPITTYQINTINRNCQWNVEIKEEWVQWVTGDSSRTSLKSITQGEAVRIIKQQTGAADIPKTEIDNWGYFDNNNPQHKRIQADLRTANIVVKNEKWGEVGDMLGWFNRFLKSKYSPVKKPLKQMTPQEVSKIIVALDGVALWKNSI